VKTCRLRKGEKTKCLLTGDRISCPESNLAIVDFENVELCNETFGRNAQRIIFTQDDPRQANNFKTISGSIIEHILFLDSNRNRRDVDSTESRRDATSSNINKDSCQMYKYMQNFNFYMIWSQATLRSTHNNYI